MYIYLNLCCWTSPIRCSRAAWRPWCLMSSGRDERAAKQTVWMSSSRSWRTQRCQEKTSSVSTEMLLVGRAERSESPGATVQWDSNIDPPHLTLRPDHHGGAQHAGTLCDGGQQDNPRWDGHATSIHTPWCQTQDHWQGGLTTCKYIKLTNWYRLEPHLVFVW